MTTKGAWAERTIRDVIVDASRARYFDDERLMKVFRICASRFLLPYPNNGGFRAIGNP